MTMCIVSASDLAEMDARIYWDVAILIVSLDRVQGLLPELGLDAVALRPCLAAIREYVDERERYSLSDDDSPPGVAQAASLNRLLDHAQHAAGATVTAGLPAFVSRLIAREYQSREPWRSAWRTLLRRLVTKHEAAGVAAAFSIPGQALEQVYQIADRWVEQDDRNDDLLDEIEGQPLQGWDARVYASYRRETPDVSPLDTLRMYLREAAFGEAWRRILAALAPAELEALGRWGLIEAMAATSIPAGMVSLPLSARHGS